MLSIAPIPAFNDNYIWLIKHPDGKKAAVVDPGDANPVLAELEKQQLELTTVLITHHHPDHTGGINTLLSLSPNLKVYGPKTITGVNHPVEENNKFSLWGQEFKVIGLPGHTLDHIAYLHQQHLFCGDTLFSGGCGRLFEGTAKQMFSSLEKLSDLPESTLVYCAHEYTQSNLNFALAVEPDNKNLQTYNDKVNMLRQSGKATLPSNIGLEKQINPFLRSAEKAVKESANAYTHDTLNSDVEVFRAIRSWKDNF